jgi:hypothetical protein
MRLTADAKQQFFIQKESPSIWKRAGVVLQSHFAVEKVTNQTQAYRKANFESVI